MDVRSGHRHAGWDYLVGSSAGAVFPLSFRHSEFSRMWAGVIIPYCHRNSLCSLLRFGGRLAARRRAHALHCNRGLDCCVSNKFRHFPDPESRSDQQEGDGAPPTRYLTSELMFRRPGVDQNTLDVFVTNGTIERIITHVTGEVRVRAMLQKGFDHGFLSPASGSP